MREILFRCKRVDNGEWCYGYFFIDLENKKPYIMLSERIESKEEWMFKSIEVIPETVGQYIGQLDINGVRIFEGDIIVCRDEKAIVAFDNSSAMFVIKFINTKNEWSFLNAGYLGEVIGNIHDNPELAPS